MTKTTNQNYIDLSDNPALAEVLEDMRDVIKLIWSSEQDGATREDLWRQYQAIQVVDQNIQNQIRRLADGLEAAS